MRRKVRSETKQNTTDQTTKNDQRMSDQIVSIFSGSFKIRKKDKNVLLLPYRW